MLAYVFWHWPRADGDVAAYETAEADFHNALAQTSPVGFVSSAVCRVDGEAPWLGGHPAYADWYLVHDSAALDPLNVAAVSGRCQEPHRRLTRMTGAGAGSLLQLRSGQVDLSAAAYMSWLVKPRELAYDAFYAALGSVPGNLWRRQMVLGPTSEFGLLSAQSVDLPPAFSPRTLRLTWLWPPA